MRRKASPFEVRLHDFTDTFFFAPPNKSGLCVALLLAHTKKGVWLFFVARRHPLCLAPAADDPLHHHHWHHLMHLPDTSPHTFASPTSPPHSRRCTLITPSPSYHPIPRPAHHRRRCITGAAPRVF